MGVVGLRGGFSIDLLHASGWILLAVVLLAPPLVATIVWGSQSG